MFAPEPKASRAQQQQHSRTNQRQKGSGGKQATYRPGNYPTSRRTSGSSKRVSSKSPLRSNQNRTNKQSENVYSAYQNTTTQIRSNNKRDSSNPSSGRSGRSSQKNNLLSRARSSISDLQQPHLLSTETYTLNMQHLQMSGITHDSNQSQLNIFGKRAMSSHSTSNLAIGNTLPKTNSQKGFSGLITPGNQDLDDIQGADDLIIDLLVQEQQVAQKHQTYAANKRRQTSSQENQFLKNQQHSIESAKQINFPLSKQQSLPSHQSMKIGIRKFEKNLRKTNKSQSKACLQMLPENASVVNAVIQKRRKPKIEGPVVHSKEEFKVCAQVIHFALSRRMKQTQPLFTTESNSQKLRGLLSQREQVLQRNSSGQLCRQQQHQKSFDQRNNENNSNLRGDSGRSSSAQRDQNTIISFGQNFKKQLIHQASTSSQKQLDYQKYNQGHSLSIDATSNNMSFGGLNKQRSTLSKGQSTANMPSLKEVDLRAEEILDAYCVIMRKNDPQVNIEKEYQVYNLLAKLSNIVATQKDMTWSKALESHFNHNTFKERSSRVSKNFIFRKFFCRWLEQYLVVHQSNNATRDQIPPQQQSQQQIKTTQTDTRQSMMMDDPVHTYGDAQSSTSNQHHQHQHFFQQSDTYNPNELIRLNVDSQAIISDEAFQQQVNHQLVGSSFGVTKTLQNHLLDSQNGVNLISSQGPTAGVAADSMSDISSLNRLALQQSQIETTSRLHHKQNQLQYEDQQMVLMQHAPSQQTLINECAATIEGAKSPNSESQQQFLFLQSPGNVLSQQQLQLAALMQQQNLMISQQQQMHQPAYSFGGNHPVQQQPQQYIPIDSLQVAANQTTNQQQQQVQNTMNFTPMNNNSAANNLQQQKHMTQPAVILQQNTNNSQGGSGLDMQKAIVTLLSQRTMNETLSDVGLQQTMQTEQFQNNLSQGGLSNDTSGFQKKSLTQLVKQMQSQNDSFTGLQRAQRLNQRMKSLSMKNSLSPPRNVETSTISDNGTKNNMTVELSKQNNPPNNVFKRRTNNNSSQQDPAASRSNTIGDSKSNSMTKPIVNCEDDESNFEDRQQLSQEQSESIKRGLRKAKRVIQAVRQRVSEGFLRFTYTDEWLREAIYRWKQYDRLASDTVPVKQDAKLTTLGVSDGEDELGALALVDNMLTAMQHRQTTMKLRCFSGLFLHMQRCRLMSQMSEQMELQHQMKTAQKVLFEWHRRFKNRQQRRNRLRIADGYFSYRLISQTFSAWHGFKQSVAQQHAQQLQQNRMVVKACQFMGERQFGHGMEGAIDNILVKQVFRQLKSSYERIREFKCDMAEKMLRCALLELQRAALRQKQIRSIVLKHFRRKSRVTAGYVLQALSENSKRSKQIKRQCFIMAIKRGGRMKKLIWKVLSRNAKARKTERQEIQFSSIFFYQLIMKRSFKGFLMHKRISQVQTAKFNKIKTILGHKKLQQMMKTFKNTCKKLKSLRQNKLKFTSEFHPKHLQIQMFRFWQEGITNQQLTTQFKQRSLQGRALTRLRLGTQHMSWNHRIVEHQLLERKKNSKLAIFRSLDSYACERQRLRTLYLTQFSAVTSQMKKLVFSELRNYATKTSELNQKQHKLRSQINRKRKANVMRELRQYTEGKILLHSVTFKAQQRLKVKVLNAMASACRRQVLMNETLNKVTTEHYKTLCKGLLTEWKTLMLQKVQSRENLLTRQQKFQAKRFFGKLRLVTQIGHIKRDVLAKLQAFRFNRLKSKSIESWKAYLHGEECAKQKQARKLRAKQLRNRGLQALKICASRGSRYKFFQQRHATQTKHVFLEKWLNAVEKLNKHRQIFSDLSVCVKQKVYRALKAHWARRQIKKAQFEQCMLLRRHFLKEQAMNSWLAFCARQEEKRHMDQRKGCLADNIYLATLMHHWLQKAKKGHSVRAIGFLVERQHKKLLLAKTLQTMRIEFHKQCFVDQVNKKRSILQVQDIFNSLREYKNSRRSRRELNETRVQILVLQRKRKVFQTLKMQHFLSKIAKPPMLKPQNRYAQVTQTPTLETRRQSRSRSRSKNASQGRYAGNQGPNLAFENSGALSMSTLSNNKGPRTPKKTFENHSHSGGGFMHQTLQYQASTGSQKYRYAMEGAQPDSNNRNF